jgi:hypothetical protein
MPGDLVYIHYSGHGIRRDIELPHVGGDNISGTALVPMDAMCGGAYLTGYQLGVYVKRMVSKKLRVGVTLDSCFSGRAFRGGRHDNQIIRTSEEEFDDIILPSDEEADALAQADDADEGQNSIGGHRNAAPKYSWLLNPSNSTVLTACSVNQTAGELFFGTGFYGALTYCALELLWKHSAKQQPSYDRVASHVNERFRKLELLQRPVIHGDNLYEFFGKREIIERSSCHVSKINDIIALDVGRVQGVAVGAVYEIESKSWDASNSSAVTTSSMHGGRLQRVRVSKVSEFSSIAELISNDDNPPSQAIFNLGTRAVLHTWALPLKTLVKLHLPRLPESESIRNALRAEVEKTPGLLLGKADPTLIVSCDREGIFKVRNEKGDTLHGIPKISSSSENSIQKLGHVVRHLARFQAIEQRQYGGARDTQSIPALLFELQDDNGIPLPKGPSGIYRVVEKLEVIVMFRSSGSTSLPVHVALFNLTPTWGILKIYPAGGQPTEALHSNIPITLTMNVEIPPSLPNGPIIDVIRAYVYVGNDPPDWGELELADLPADGKDVQFDILVESKKLEGEVKEKENAGRHFRPKAVEGRIDVGRGFCRVLDLKVRTYREGTMGRGGGNEGDEEVE